MPLPPNSGPPVGSVPEPNRANKEAYGVYLAGPAGHCTECHSTPGSQGASDLAGSLGAGGMQFKGPWGVSVAPNITPTGVGKWTDAQIKAAITRGVRPDASKLLPPMGIPYYANIAPADLDAIVAYLRTLPAK
ncbi:MAG: cytochrome c [Alphaproteobacteria bacterium]|nr:cytochrome c [Alphaproteobacteria bacterium]